MLVAHLAEFFDVSKIFFTVLDYPVSYVEFVGTTTGLASVLLAAKANIWTWATGLINVACFFIIFYQVQLYSDMFLQVYFFAASIWGWIIWNRQNNAPEHPIQILSRKQKIVGVLLVVSSTVLLGLLIKNIHLILPEVFAKPASYPFLDTFVAVLSVVATVFLARRILENWVLWILVDVLSVGLYAAKGVRLIAIEYFIFLCIASFGFYNWQRLRKR